MGLQVVEADGGKWNVVDDTGEVLASETSNGAAWRAVERLEVRSAGRLSSLYQTDRATEVRKR